MKKKKIAVVLSAEPQNGGEFQYASLVMKCIHKLSGKQFKAIAICTNKFWYRWCRQHRISFVKCDWPKVTIKQLKQNFRFPLYSRVYNTYNTVLGKLIRSKKIDVLFLTDQFKYVPNLNVKIIAPLQDLMHRYEPDFPEVKESYEWREACLKCQIKYADYILTDSELGKKQLQESYLKKRRRNPNVVSLPYVVPEHIGEKREEPIDVPDKYIFYPAQFWKHKNHINLIKAIQLLQKSIDDIHLVLVGSEKNCFEEIETYIVENRLENYVTILGFVNNENITYLYKHAVGLVMPSYFGPTNIPPLEAMALGCPVAVSNKYAMPEQVGKAGLFFNPDSPEEIAECIRMLWTDEKLREKIIERGYKRALRWTEEDFMKRVLKIVEGCL